MSDLEGYYDDNGAWITTAAVCASITDKYTLGKYLGQPGAFGYARKGTNKTTGEEVAVKVLAKSKNDVDASRAEFEMMTRLEHKHIIRAVETFEDDSNFYIVMELCNGEELFDRIETKKRYSERDAAFVIRQIVLGLEYLHEQKVAHCDLKPDNFLFLDEKEDGLKIIDFGMARITQHRAYLSKRAGTPFYMAPEVHEGTYTYHCDMWSLGVVMFVMLFGYPPFNGRNNAQIERKVRGGFKPQVKRGYGPHFPAAIPVSNEARSLMSRLINSDPTLRLTATECLNHPWLRDPNQNSSTPLAVSFMSNLAGFRSTCRLRDLILDALSDALDEEDSDALKETFLQLDQDGDGILSIDELKQAFAKLVGSEGAEGMEGTINALIALDTDGDGAISYKECVMASVHKKLCANKDRVLNVFNMLDLDEDGKLDADEISQCLGQFMEDTDDVMEIIAEVDVNGDGVIDYEEFVKIFFEQAKTAEDDDEDEDVVQATGETETATE